MLIKRDSAFRRLPVDLHPHQASFLEGIRICAEMIDIAYGRLTEALWEISTVKPTAIPVASILLDAWAVIDSVHRLRDLLDQLPRMKKNGPKWQLFERKTKVATEFRHVIQHLRGELRGMAENGWPAWGSIEWCALLDAKSCLVSSCIIIPGRVQTSERGIQNPAGLSFARRIDHVVLVCKTDRVSLTALFAEVESMIQMLESALGKGVADQPTLPTDAFAYFVSVRRIQVGRWRRQGHRVYGDFVGTADFCRRGAK